MERSAPPTIKQSNKNSFRQNSRKRITEHDNLGEDEENSLDENSEYSSVWEDEEDSLDGNSEHNDGLADSNSEQKMLIFERYELSAVCKQSLITKQRRIMNEKTTEEKTTDEKAIRRDMKSRELDDIKDQMLVERRYRAVWPTPKRESTSGTIQEAALVESERNDYNGGW